MIENDPAKWCQCQACQQLRAECGSHYAWLSGKLLQHGWAGALSPAEKAYRRAHSPAKAPPTERQAAVRERFRQMSRQRPNRD